MEINTKLIYLSVVWPLKLQCFWLHKINYSPVAPVFERVSKWPFKMAARCGSGARAKVGVPDGLGVDVHGGDALQQKLHHLQEWVGGLLGERQLASDLPLAKEGKRNSASQPTR